MFKFNPMFKKTKYITLKNSVNDRDNEENTPNIPSGMWIKCSGCGKILYKRDLEENFKICPQCGKHYRMSAKERIDLIVDTGPLGKWIGYENIKSFRLSRVL